MKREKNSSLIEKNDFGFLKNDSTEKMNFPPETKYAPNRLATKKNVRKIWTHDGCFFSKNK
mgnify:CR=1 FL=1